MQNVNIPKIERETSATKTTLMEQDRRDLFAMTQLPGYGVFLRLMEMKCILQDAALMAVDEADDKRVLAEHRITKAKWEFFAEVQGQVQHEVNELFAPAGEKVDPEQQEMARILDATQELQ